ncbi:uncharacterized protein BYT42DRAFT_383275 [Radiomyces spectabilis]|uniref:uncharacterized protein n=1 Tax=Radiomyces spectabilis TaxID=64574 RepID=UPI00221E8515|nr:uncharacterized protein BYT42DRAFT_383275 [Radiomyces spectabilis]KAI8376334.1 hypothetical protein BYT42DRAFT_383275 [Radiomyces spectabilis]
MHAQLCKKKPSPEDGKTKCSPMAAVANCWISHGSAFPEDSALGVALVNYGQAESQISMLGDEFANQVKDGYMATLERGLQEYKEYLSLKKKLESRRLDYDAKLSRLQKSKKEKPELEQETQAAKIKYEEIEYDIIQKMAYLQEYEDEHFEALTQLLEAQYAYFSKSADLLNEVRSTWGQGVASAPIARNMMHTVLSRTSSSHSAIGGIGGIAPVGRSSRQGSMDDYFGQNNDVSSHGSRSPGSLQQRRPSSRKPSSDSLSVGGPPPRRIPSRTSLRSNHNNNDDLMSSGSRLTPPTIPRRQSQASIGTKKRRKAVYDFEGASSDELSFATGDIITVIDEVDEGWWLGEVDHGGATKRQGIFPVNYTEELVAPPMPARPSTSTSHTSQIQEYPVEEAMAETESPFADHMTNGNTDYGYQQCHHTPTRTLSTHSYTSAAPSPPPSSSLPRGNSGVPVNLASKPSMRTPPPPPAARQRSMSNTPKLVRTAPPTPQSRAAPDYFQASPVAQPDCQDCGCNDFSANLFKKGHCNNCFHKHF